MRSSCPSCHEGIEEPLERCPACGTALSEEDTDPLIGTDLDGKYGVISRIGHGGMGTVYRAHQQSVGRDVAIKVLRWDRTLHQTAVARFRREVRAAALLSHPNIITVHDFGQASEGLLYIVMEYLPGVVLRQLVESEAPLPLMRAAQIVSQVCDALTEAHDKGVVHRDLKPSNIMLLAKHGNPDFVKVLDFGVAKLLRSDVQSELTSMGEVCGSLSYISPEQIDGKPLDGRADLYALGVVFYELLTGRRPFVGSTPVLLVEQHLNDPVPAMARVNPHITVPPVVERLVANALAKKPQGRPQSAVVFKQQLHEAMAGRVATVGRDTEKIPLHPTETPPQPPTAKAPRPRLSSTKVDLRAGRDQGLADPIPPTEPYILLPTSREAISSGGNCVPPKDTQPFRLNPSSGPPDWEQEPGTGERRGAARVVLFVMLLGLVAALAIWLAPDKAPSAEAGKAPQTSTDPPPRRSSPPQRLTAEEEKNAAGVAAEPNTEEIAGPTHTRLMVTSRPVGAVVTHGGRPLCVTPCDTEMPSKTGEAKLVFSLSGYHQAVRHAQLQGPEVDLREVVLDPVKSASGSRARRHHTPPPALAPAAEPSSEEGSPLNEHPGNKPNRRQLMKIE